MSMFQNLLAYICVECAVSASVLYFLLYFNPGGIGGTIRSSDLNTALAAFASGMAAKPLTKWVMDSVGAQ